MQALRAEKSTSAWSTRWRLRGVKEEKAVATALTKGTRPNIVGGGFLSCPFRAKGLDATTQGVALRYYGVALSALPDCQLLHSA